MKSIILTLLMVFAQPVFAAPGDITDTSDKDQAVGQMNDLIDLLKKIEFPTEWHEKGRLVVLRTQAQRVAQAIQNPKIGLAHMAVMREYQSLIIAFRYSTSYFNTIKAGASSGEIETVLRIVEGIVKQRGFDDSPYTTITQSVFKQIRQLISELQSQPIPAALKADLSALLPEIGRAIAMAEQGDRPRTFDVAGPLVKRLRALYPKFMAVSASDGGFETVLNIQGLTEFYAEYSQADSRRPMEISTCKPETAR